MRRLYPPEEKPPYKLHNKIASATSRSFSAMSEKETLWRFHEDCERDPVRGKSVPHTESRKPREPYMKKRRSSAPSKYLLA